MSFCNAWCSLSLDNYAVNIFLIFFFKVKTLLHFGGIATGVGGWGGGGEGVIEYTGMLQGKCRSCPLADCSRQAVLWGKKDIWPFETAMRTESENPISSYWQSWKGGLPPSLSLVFWNMSQTFSGVQWKFQTWLGIRFVPESNDLATGLFLIGLLINKTDHSDRANLNNVHSFVSV